MSLAISLLTRTNETVTKTPTKMPITILQFFPFGPATQKPVANGLPAAIAENKPESDVANVSLANPLSSKGEGSQEDAADENYTIGSTVK